MRGSHNQPALATTNILVYCIPEFKFRVLGPETEYRVLCFTLYNLKLDFFLKTVLITVYVYVGMCATACMCGS